MPADPAAFLAFLRDQSLSLTPDERSALLSLADEQEPFLSQEKLISRLSRFLLDHQDLDRRLADQQGERIAGAPIKLKPEQFKTNLRNIVLQPQQSPKKNGGSSPEH